MLSTVVPLRASSGLISRVFHTIDFLDKPVKFAAIAFDDQELADVLFLVQKLEEEAVSVVACARGRRGGATNIWCARPELATQKGHTDDSHQGVSKSH